MIKRAFDIALALAGLLVTSPLLAILAIAVKRSSPGPVLYRGVRVGRHGRPFTILKFRTMVAHAERIGGTSTSDDDPRVTRVGTWMRKYKLDELPQLFNVLSGSMSLVGPRPQVAWAVDRYTPQERALLSVRPGLTDYASIHFSNEGEILRGAVDADTLYLELIAPTKIRLGLEYVQRRSWFEDLRILLATVIVALGRRPPAILVDFDRLLTRPTAAGSASEAPRMESGFTPRP